MTFVTPAQAQDIDAIAALLEELDRFYGASDVESASKRVSQINAALFEQQPASAQALLAWEDGQLVGFAAYSFLWPAVGVTRSLYLKELYVAQGYRRSGVGKLLMQHLCEVAAEYGCSRVEWTTDKDNAEAQRFYEKLGLSEYSSKVFYRLEGQDLLRVADSAVGPGVNM